MNLEPTPREQELIEAFKASEELQKAVIVEMLQTRTAPEIAALLQCPLDRVVKLTRRTYVRTKRDDVPDDDTVLRDIQQFRHLYIAQDRPDRRPAKMTERYFGE